MATLVAIALTFGVTSVARADDLTPTAVVTKTAAVPGNGPVQPGMEFAYQIYLECSSTEVDCPGFVFTDVIPEGLDVVQLPLSNSTRTVSFDEASRTLTMTYSEDTDNPPGTGWLAGSNEAFDIVVRLPEDTGYDTDDTITNVAVVEIDEHGEWTDEATVTVDIPVAVTPMASKQWPGSGVVAGSGAPTTAIIGAANASSSSATVTSLSVTDVESATWEHFDLTTVTLTALPEGATEAQLFVCTEAGSACGDGDWVSGGTASGPGPLTLPGGVAAGAVTGVRVEFNAAGAPLPRAPLDGGAVELGLELRNTLRSSADPIAPEAPITVNNCVTAAAQEGAATPVVSIPSCDGQQIWPSTVTVSANKVWVPDTNGNWEQNTGEHAVAGAESRVTARVRATNQSPFPIHQVVITEPSATETTDFGDFDVDRIRLTFPDGATTARVQITYVGDLSTDEIYTAPPATQVIPVGEDSQVTSVTVTYTGGAADNPAIAAGATAGLDLNGQLTDAVDTDGNLENCADIEAIGASGTTPAGASPCGTLVVEEPNVSGQGIKNGSQPTIPEDQPVTFTMRLTNNGNLALIDPILTDPADPAAPDNPFNSLALVSAASTSSPAGLDRTIEVFDGDEDEWVAYVAGDLPDDVRGVRVRVDDDLPPTGWVQLNVTVERRPGVADDLAIENCFVASASNPDSTALLGAGVCASVTTGVPDGGAALTKAISPDELPEWTPGLSPQEATVTLRVSNAGNLSAQYLEVTDDDVDFFDAVDLVSFAPRQNPAGANQLRIEALIDGTWEQVYEGNAGTPSPTFPGGSTAADVRGLRFTFSNSGGGYALTPCVDDADGCAGYVRFVVSPRASLVSDPDTPLPAVLENTVTGRYLTNIDDPENPPSTPPATDSLELVPGDPRADVNKGPNNITLGPGSTALQTVTVTNNGTTWLTNVSVVDALPAGLAFDELYDGDDGNPYTVSMSNVPAGYDPPPAPTFVVDRDGERIDSVRWTFEGWAMPPNATIELTFRVGLEPGVTAGQSITNTMGATGESGAPGKTLECTPPDGTELDGDFGDGVYCTDTATVTVIAGAAFQARKWVAGNPALGWWHPTLGFVPTGDSSCPSISDDDVLYTATPCVALVDRGGQFDYILRVVNAGTEVATRMALIDNLPHQGDSGLIGGAARGTEWNNRPTLAGPATFAGPGTGTLGYSSAAPGSWCTDDLYLGGAGCGADDWADAAGSSTTAIRLLVDFVGDPLNPGENVEIRFAMNVPTSIQQDSDVTIAWNSFAHAEATQSAQGERILPPIEPIKVGVSPLLPPVPPVDPPVPPVVDPPGPPDDLSDGADVGGGGDEAGVGGGGLLPLTGATVALLGAVALLLLVAGLVMTAIGRRPIVPASSDTPAGDAPE